MRFLVTRPEPEATRFAEALRARGHEALVAPLLAVAFREGPPFDLAGMEAAIATSANGVRALARRTARRDVPVWAVGPQTAAAARAAGFSQVEHAGGGGAALRDAIARAYAPGTRLLHAAGSNGAPFVLAGYDILRVELYDMIAAERLPTEVRTALKDGTLDGAFFFSPKSSAVFASCVAKDGLLPLCARLDAYCIGAAAANFLTPLPFAHFCIAAYPNRDALLAMLPHR
jgi:uroporphyrinogen-III synthase